MTRRFVPFDGLWSMAIDVPYSYLLRDGDLAWSCGQLALDSNSTVMYPGDLASQSHVVIEYVEQILARAELSAENVTRLYLYHAAPSRKAEQSMLSIFRQRFGPLIDLQPIAVPHFYYDGVLLEVDVWWSNGDELRWGSSSHPSDDTTRLSEHCIVPTAQLDSAVDVPDPGAVIDGGSRIDDMVLLHIDVPERTVTTEVLDIDGTVSVLRRCGEYTWLQGRSADASLDLVGHTESVMARFDEVLDATGLGYGDVAKSTTHYVGGSSADELHGNMSVRNRRYSKPGPASTGLPVFGFADPASKVVVDITLVRRDGPDLGAE